MPVTTKTKAKAKPAAKTAPVEAKKPAKASGCARCGGELSGERCPVCEPLTGTYKLGADGSLVRVSADVPGLNRGGSESGGSESSGGACGSGPSFGGGCGGGMCH